MIASAFRRHAQDLLDQELHRRRGAMARLPGERRAAVEELVTRAVAASVDGILEQACDDPLVAAAFESLYGSRSVLMPASVAPD
jgi:hypothetical protein